MLIGDAFSKGTQLIVSSDLASITNTKQAGSNSGDENSMLKL